MAAPSTEVTLAIERQPEMLWEIRDAQPDLGTVREAEGSPGQLTEKQAEKNPGRFARLRASTGTDLRT